MSSLSPACVKHTMSDVPGSYDGVDVTKMSTCDYIKLGHKKLYYPVQEGKFSVPHYGGSYPLPHEEKFQKLSTDMFIFAKNKASPLCCPSNYMTDRGCVCMTKEQSEFIHARRGGNKNFPDDSY